MAGSELSLAVFAVLVDALRLVIFVSLYRAERAPHLRWWTWAFALQGLAQTLVLPSLFEVPGTAAVRPLAFILIVAAVLLMLRGTFALVGRPWQRGWVAFAALAFVTGGVLALLDVPLVVASLGPMFFLAAGYLAVAASVWGLPRRPDGLGARLTVFAAVLTAVHYADFPFLGDVRVVASWGLALSVFNEVALSLGFLLLHTEQSRAARDDAEASVRDLADAIGVGLLETTLEGKFVSVNDGFVRMLGYATQAEVLALDIPRDLYVNAADRPALLDRSRREGKLVGVDLKWRRKDGATLDLQEYSRPVLDAKGNVIGVRGFVVDRTAANQLAERVRHAQKLDAIGQLAGGVAHDFNNLLTVIQTAHALLEQAQLDEDERAVLRDADEAATQAAHLTRRLLAFGRKQPTHAEVFDAGAVVKRTTQMVSRTLTAKHRLDVSGVAGPHHVRMDPGHLEQVVVNLVLNARDAMDEGVITIGMRDARRAEAAGVEVWVADTGRGMSAEERRRLFEPFFTTKEPGRGTGLGLSTVHGIVEQAGGAIDVESEPGRGSRFTVWLPSVPGKQPEPRAAGKRRVLVVDDEPAIRRAACRILEAAGCETVEAVDGADAVARFKGGGFDVLLSDVRMPGLTGHEVAKAVRELAPATRIVLMSGYTEEAPSPLADAFLPKPFTPDDLVTVVQATSAAR
ncbi:MAG: response regulator [Myxococcaceae bacterium]|nr:response regulator [Myxococcaceae bacterium]